MTLSFLRGALGAAALACLCEGAFCQSALAHTVLERKEAEAGQHYRGVLRLGHGCKGSPTTALSVSIPEGAVIARPMAKPGWTIATRRNPYTKSYRLPWTEVSEGITEITWSGGRVPDDHFDEFVFTVRMGDDLKPGQILYFPVEQTCETGAHHWTAIPAAGQDPHALPEPAPTVRIVAPAAQMAQAVPAKADAPPAAASIKVGDLVIDAPWIRATPGGAKVAGGYLRVTNGGTAPDRLVATSIPLAGRGEVHEMSMEAGVMKMRPVEGGLEIAPGSSVELKPGGFHLMFMDLTGGLKEGETVKGTLTFQRAGTVEVTFAVGGLGARVAPGGHGNH